MKHVKLTPQERGIEQALLKKAEKQIERGEVVSWAEVKRRHRLCEGPLEA